VAGPWRGKTFCLNRPYQLPHQHPRASTRAHLRVTFTNRAAEEIAVRRRTPWERAEAITRGTITRCVCAAREHAEPAGLKEGLRVADEQYQKVILAGCTCRSNSGDRSLNRFSRHRRAEAGLRAHPDDAAACIASTPLVAHRNMVDFDDLVAKAERAAAHSGDIGRCDRGALGLHSWWTSFQDVTRFQYACETPWRRTRPTSSRWATTSSRSSPGRGRIPTCSSAQP